MRPDWDTYFMQLATLAATRSTCDRLHVGCIVSRDNRALVTAYNGSLPGLPHCDDVGHLLSEIEGRQSCIRVVHAELNAVSQAARHGISICGCTAYITAFPCWACTRALVSAGIQRIVYGHCYGVATHTEEAIAQLGIMIEHKPLA